MKRAGLLYHADRGRVVAAEWLGATWLPVEVNMEATRYLPAPYDLRKVDDNLWLGTAIYARSDGWRIFTWAFWWTHTRALRAKYWLLKRLYRAAYRTGRFHPPEAEILSLRTLLWSWRA